MHAIEIDDAIVVNYNSDWSGDAFVRGYGPDMTWTVNAAALVAGDFIPGDMTPPMPVAIALRVVSVVSAEHLRAQIRDAVEGIDTTR